MSPLQTPRVLWVALFISTILYIVIWFQVRGQVHTPPNPMMLPIFGVFALGCAVMSFVLPGTQYKRGVQMSQLRITYEPDPNPISDVIPMGDAPGRKVFADAKMARRRALILFQTTFILGMALSEAVSLCGFALAFLGFPVVTWIPFFIVTWILFALRFPTEDNVFGRFARTYGAAYPTVQ